MNNITRSGVNIQVAFLSSLKKKMDLESRNEDKLVDVSSESYQVQHGFSFKKLLRPFVRYFYRKLLKPVLRPSAFRMRRYLVDGLRQETQQELQKTSAATLSNIQRNR